MKLKNKKIVVTGGSNGIGKAITQKFMAEGGIVTVFDVIAPDFDVEFQLVDVANEQQVISAFSKQEKLDVLVNNAGVYFQSLTEATDGTDLARIFDINVKGAYLMTKHALPLLKKTQGNIITISSALGEVPEPSSPAYCASKSALNMLTKCWAQAYAAQGVRANAILPGPIDTPLLRKALATPVELEAYRQLNPMRKIGKPEDVAAVAVFLASDEASFVTGGLYSVDGGESSSSVYSIT